jgi:hypothetical protein
VPVPTPSQSAPGNTAAGGYYGALAYSPANHAIVGQGTGATASAAELAAMSDCARSDCIPIARFEDAHATFALGAGGAWGWGYGSTGAEADASAVGYCRANGGGGSCRPLARPVTAAPSQAATGVSLDGRVCMINAPSGAQIGKLPVAAGHVGWAFLVDWFTGEWMYGANEGPGNVVYGNQASKTWSGQGHWADLVSSFTGALNGPGGVNYYHPAGYYKTYRCESEPLNDSARATNTFVGLQDKPYNLMSNDCLTNAVEVLVADGTTGLSTNFVLPPHDLPNWYYKNDLPGFEPERPL